MPLCLIGLGSNQGDRRTILDRALRRLAEYPGIRLVRQSSYYETAAVGGPPGQGSFLNGAALLETALGPEAVLQVLQHLEAEAGRRPTARWGPRPLDLDLLVYSDVVMDGPGLVLPHPRMAWRRFVLQPAAEIAGEMIHPTTGWTIARLWEHLNTTPTYVALAGPSGAGKTELAERLVQFAGARWIAEVADVAWSLTPRPDSVATPWHEELQWLHRRAQSLKADLPQWQEPGVWWVSDFWLGQSLAFARVRLAADQWSAFEQCWHQAAQNAIQPKLTVLLDASTDRLLERLGKRDGGKGRNLRPEQLDCIREAITACLARKEVGPVLRLVNLTVEQSACEVLAAVKSMQ